MLETAIMLIFPIFLSLALGWDVATFTIPNWLNIGLVLLFIPAALLAHLSFEAIGWHVLIGVILLGLGMGLFAAGYAGGGDAKFLAAIGLWLGPSALVAFLLYTALAGGLLALGLLAFRGMPIPYKWGQHEAVMRLHEPGGGIPYGVALSAAALLVYPATPVFVAFS